jgi:hypothetical protein
MSSGKIVALGAIVAAGLFAVSVLSAQAYPIGGAAGASPQPTAPGYNYGAGPSGTVSQSLNQLSTPFNNFFQSLENVWNSTIGAPPTTEVEQSWAAQGIAASADNIFQSFDNWFYQTFGFHISDFFIAILNILQWILNFVLGIVNWILGVIK